MITPFYHRNNKEINRNQNLREEKMSKQNRGRIIVLVALVAVLLFIAIGLFLLRNKNNQRRTAPSAVSQEKKAIYTGGVSANTVGVGTYYRNNAH
jgi:hypothetical protein